MEKRNDKVLTMRINAEELRKIKKIAQNQGRTSSNLIRYILKNYLELHG